MFLHRASLCLWTLAALAVPSLCMRPEKIKVDAPRSFSLCGIKEFKSLNTQATFADAKSIFLDGCQEKYPVEKCNFAVAELWQGRDLASKVEKNSDFCQTLRLVVAASIRPSLSQEAETHASLGRAVSGKFLSGLFGQSHGAEEEADEEEDLLGDDPADDEIDQILARSVESAVTVPAEVIHLKKGASECSKGVTPEEDECEAVGIRALTELHFKMKKFSVVNKKKWPSGCSLKGQKVFFNKKADGEGHNKIKLICVETVDLPPPDFDFPAGLMTCHAGPAVLKTRCSIGLEGKSREIRDRIKDHFEGIGEECTAASCPRGDFAGCLVRLVGHDIMDFREGAGGGADGCIDFNDFDNKGLKGCMLDAVGISSDPGRVDLTLETMWQDYCTSISLADFFVITAEALIEATLPAELVHFGAEMESRFRFGRETQTTCSVDHRLPNPNRACDANKELFIDELGLDWRGTTALMGVHTLGRALLQNSGFSGSWVSGPHASSFDNRYYKAMLDVGWVPFLTSQFQWQWNRADGKHQDEMMLDTDLCLAYRIGDRDDQTLTSFTNGNQDHCAWVHKDADDLQGIDCRCEGISLSAGCTMQNCCNPGTGILEEPTGNDPVGDRKGSRLHSSNESDSLHAVVDFARSNEVWLNAFVQAWEKVTTNGFDNLCDKF